MILCNPECYPCCDFCIHAIHEKWTDKDGEHIGGPEGCSLHTDQKHQEIAEDCGDCNDFHCSLANEANAIEKKYEAID